MGWNSWYVWQDRVSDQIMREAADAMVSTGLIDHGYMYVNVDDCWMVKPESNDPLLGGQPRDAEGNINPNKCFPDMKALTAYIHGRGLKAGIYTAVGQLTCCRGMGVYGHEEQDARRFAEWGFDFLKLDWCSYFGNVPKRYGLPGWQEPYRLMGDILKTLDRDLVFNFVPNTNGRKYITQWARTSGGQSWRTAVDLGGPWENIQSRRLRSLRPQRIAEVQRARRLERSGLSVAGLRCGRQRRHQSRRRFRPTNNTPTCRCGAW